jgi:hypothetical protein
MHLLKRPVTHYDTVTFESSDSWTTTIQKIASLHKVSSPDPTSFIGGKHISVFEVLDSYNTLTLYQKINNIQIDDIMFYGLMPMHRSDFTVICICDHYEELPE